MLARHTAVSHTVVMWYCDISDIYIENRGHWRFSGAVFFIRVNTLSLSLTFISLLCIIYKLRCFYNNYLITMQRKIYLCFNIIVLLYLVDNHSIAGTYCLNFVDKIMNWWIYHFSELHFICLYHDVTSWENLNKSVQETSWNAIYSTQVRVRVRLTI